jgi:PAS domain S-box-containing protein
MNFLPHGYCFAWTPGLLWSMVGADSLIAAAYFSIPIAIVSVVRRRGDSSLHWIPWLFSGFIFACGITHVMDVWTIWQPYYRAQTLAKGLTAAISIVTAVALWRLIPSILAVPRVSQLQEAIRSLEAEAARRLQAEDSLLDSRQGLAVTLASIGAGFIATDREGRVTHMNAVAGQLTGWGESEARGRILWDVFVRADRPPHYRAANPVDLMQEQNITIDAAHHVEVLARSGGRTEVEVKADLIRGADGGVRGAVMVFRDTSRLARAEAEARRLAAIVESSNDAIIGKDRAGNITTWNPAAQAMFGYAPEEVVGRSVLTLVPASCEAQERRNLATLAGGSRVPTFDTMGLAKDGSEFHVSVTVSPILDAGGTVVGASRIARDVSVARRAEAALRDSEAKLRFIMDAARIGEWDLDLRTGIGRQSALHAQCFGYQQPVPGWGMEQFKRHLHADDRATVERLLAAAAAGGPLRFDGRVIWPDRSVHWIAVHGSVLAENGRPTRMLGIVMDITEQKLAEDARHMALRLEAENQQIQEASRLKSLFLANMSHELRTPLNAIIGFSDLLHSGAVSFDSPKHREFIGHIAASGRHLLQLINDILDLSKVESGKFQIVPQPVDLRVLLKEVRDVFHAAIQRKSVNLVEQFDASLDPALRVDPARLKQALCNYVSNAIKFTPNGGRVVIRAMPEGAARFRVEVEDDGIGIAEADLPKLFNEFQQLDAGLNKQHQGTGLGLALTRRLVEAQGGRVGVRSVLGRGSIFFLTMDRIHAGGEPEAAAPASLGAAS